MTRKPQDNTLEKLTRWLHRRGLHSYSIPIKRYKEQIYYVEGKDGAGSQEKFEIFMRVKCKHCNKRKNKLEETTVRTWA